MKIVITVFRLVVFNDIPDDTINKLNFFSGVVKLFIKKVVIMETKSIFKQQACRICFEDTDNGILVFSDEGKKLYLQTKIRKYIYITVCVQYFFSNPELWSVYFFR